MIMFEKNAQDYVREAIAEVDPLDHGFRTSEAVRAAMAQYVADHGVQPAAGDQLLRRGFTKYVQDYRPARRKADPTWNATNTQWAGAEFFTWTQGMTALDETPDAIRKRIVDLDYDEAAQVAAMHRDKAAALLALSDQIGRVMARNPLWEHNRLLTLGQVINLVPMPMAPAA